jgi:hypothetical protein
MLDALQTMHGNLQSTTSALPIRACFRRLSVNVLKIDESLVQQITLGERDSTIVNVMIEVRQQVIAGGVQIRAPLNFQQRFISHPEIVLSSFLRCDSETLAKSASTTHLVIIRNDSVCFFSICRVPDGGFNRAGRYLTVNG